MTSLQIIRNVNPSLADKIVEDAYFLNVTQLPELLKISKSSAKADRIKQLEFAIQFSTTNIRYLAGDESPDLKRIDWHKTQINEMQKELESLNS